MEHGRSITCLQAPQLEKPKRLSLWVLKGRKEACEAELKEIRDRGSDYPMGFEYDSKADRLRAKELKINIRELNKAMQNADS